MPSAQRPANASVEAFLVLPDPGRAGSVEDLVERLRMLKVWAGDPSYEWIKDRVNGARTAAGSPASELAATTTVKDCFRPGRRRLNADLVIAVVRALHPDTGYVAQWRQALRVIAGESRAAAQVRVQDTLPHDLAGFTGRTAELDRLRRALLQGRPDGDAMVVATIAGMAGVGKTQLAVHAGHLLAKDKPFDQVLFVDLRGFHTDPAQPPADPGAVLEGFLRLLGVPGTRIPYDLPARATAYRDRLARRRTLVVLDNAIDEDQVRPLLPATPGCAVLVTSRRSLTGLRPATHLTVGVFTADEARAFITRAAPEIPVGDNPDAAARIAHRCGRLPLALSLIAGHIRGKPGWTLTDHADRLDERHRDRRLDSGVRLALDLSYQHLPAGQQRLLRLLALHPGQDLDAHAAAALADSDLPTARAHLDQLCRDHLLQPGNPGRYAFHDLVRAYAAGRAGDDDPPLERRNALTRLFGYYLAVTATATAALHPAEAHRRPSIPPAGTPTPALAGPDAALAWLDTERPTLVAVATYTATHGWPTHTTRLSSTLFRYLNGGYLTDALTIHGHARHAARQSGDPTGQAHSLTNLGAVHLWLGQYGPATKNLLRALHLFRRTGDAIGQARTLNNLGNAEERLGHYRQATLHFRQALALYGQAGDRTGQARALGNLGTVEERLGRHRPATDHYERALALFRGTGDRTGEGTALNNLGHAESRLGRHGPAAEHLHRALRLFRRIGSHTGEAWSLEHLGTLHTRLDRPAQAVRFHQRALAIQRETGDREGEAWALNGLGEATRAAGRPGAALAYHTAALTIATDISDRHQQARSHTGLGHAHGILGDPIRAREHYRHALAFYTDLGLPDADEIRAHLGALDSPRPEPDRAE